MTDLPIVCCGTEILPNPSNQHNVYQIVSTQICNEPYTQYAMSKPSAQLDSCNNSLGQPSSKHDARPESGLEYTHANS